MYQQNIYIHPDTIEEEKFDHEEINTDPNHEEELEQQKLSQSTKKKQGQKRNQTTVKIPKKIKITG